MNEMPTPTTKHRYLTTAETAKLVREALKQFFPGQKFSVRSKNYAGGSSIDVSWIDGPTCEAVQKVTDSYEGGRFDGQCDLAYHAEHWYCQKHGARVARTYGHSHDADGGGVGNAVGESQCCARAELVNMGADYVFTSRALSAEFREELRVRICRDSGLSDDAMDEDTVLPRDSVYAFGPYDRVRDAIHRLSQEITR